MNILFINEGLASAVLDFVWRRGHKTISYWVEAFILAKNLITRKNYRVVHSTNPFSKGLMRGFIRRRSNKKNNLIVILKSYGGYEFIRWLDGRFDKGKKTGKTALGGYKSVKVFFVDPNSANTGEKARQFDIRKHMTKNMKCYCYYQRKKTPHGFKILGATNMDLTKEKNMSHFEIIKHPKVLADIQKNC